MIFCFGPCKWTWWCLFYVQQPISSDSTSLSWVCRLKLGSSQQLLCLWTHWRNQMGQRQCNVLFYICIQGMAFKPVSNFVFLGMFISEDLSWTINTSSLIKKENQNLVFLRTLRKNKLSASILGNFYHCVIERILISCITVWDGNCSVSDLMALQRLKTAHKDFTCHWQCLEEASDGCLAFSRTALILPTLCYRSSPPTGISLRTSMFRNSFFPSAVSLTLSLTEPPAPPPSPFLVDCHCFLLSLSYIPFTLYTCPSVFTNLYIVAILILSHTLI